jgi:hypothetical protein
MGEERDNPIIGYLLIDRAQRVIGPPGKDVAFHSEASARRAAERYGRAEEVVRVAPLYWGGLLSVIWEDVGDIYLDGPAAKGLVEVCRQQGIKVKAEERWRIKGTVEEAIYSSRVLVGSQAKGWVKK